MVGDTKTCTRRAKSMICDLEGEDGAIFNGESVFEFTDESNDEGGD